MKALIVIGALVAAGIIIAVASVSIVLMLRVQALEDKMEDVELRLKNIAEGGALVNSKLRETNERIDRLIKRL